MISPEQSPEPVRDPVTVKERQAILDSLRAGLVPRLGLKHVQVGRKEEVQALASSLERTRAGASAVRFVIGRFGSGKSFLLAVGGVLATHMDFVVARADLTPDRRLHGSGGQARSLFAELMRNLSTHAKPEGGALNTILDKWITRTLRSVGQTDDPSAATHAIREALKPLQDLLRGFDFAAVLTKYYEAFQSGNEALDDATIRWLRGEFNNKQEAREALGLKGISIVADAEVYDYLKLFARFVRLAGYAGMVVTLDEMVVLSQQLNNAQARRNNYETIHRILLDCLQGNAEGLCFLFGGTEDFLENKRRGLFSYEALASKLAPNQFAGLGVPDLAGPVIRLGALTREELYVLLMNVLRVYGQPSAGRFPTNAIPQFLDYCRQTLGATYFQMPRDVLVQFVKLLDALDQNPSFDWRKALGQSVAAVPASVSAEAVPPLIEDEDSDLKAL